MRKALEGYKKDVEELQDKLAIEALNKAEKQIKCNKEFIALIDENLVNIQKRNRTFPIQTDAIHKSEDEICLLALRDLAERNLK